MTSLFTAKRSDGGIIGAETQTELIMETTNGATGREGGGFYKTHGLCEVGRCKKVRVHLTFHMKSALRNNRLG